MSIFSKRLTLLFKVLLQVFPSIDLLDQLVWYIITILYWRSQWLRYSLCQVKLSLNSSDIKRDEKRAYKSLQKVADAVLHFENAWCVTHAESHAYQRSAGDSCSSYIRSNSTWCKLDLKLLNQMDVMLYNSRYFHHSNQTYVGLQNCLHKLGTRINNVLLRTR